MRRSVYWSLCLLPLALGSFFVLFFRLCYPEIKARDSKWPTTRCNIRTVNLASRYCCETACACVEAPANVTSCSPQISSLNGGFSPDKCNQDKSACPPGVGGVCDGGFRCCNTHCDTCRKCTNPCVGGITTLRGCTTSCFSSSCNCRCVQSVNRQRCTISCPTCYSVDVNLTYSATGRGQQDVTHHRDFSKNQGTAQTFFNEHTAGSTTPCSYNPSNLNEVSFDVPPNPITPWKWVVTALLGMLPLFALLCSFFFTFVILPIREHIHNRRNARELASASPEDADQNDTTTLLREDEGQAGIDYPGEYNPEHDEIATNYREDEDYVPTYDPHSPPNYTDKPPIHNASTAEGKFV